MESSHHTTHQAHWEGEKGREFKDYEACIFYLTALSTCINTICHATLRGVVLYLRILRTVFESLGWSIKSAE